VQKATARASGAAEMKSIAHCRADDGCGLRVGYDLADGTQICWLHAERQKLPAHIDWRRDYAEFLKTAGAELIAAATKRDNYGLLGR
jgi:hypothetical protein